MNIIVCLKQVPATSEIGVDAETGALLREGTACKVNPYDLYALEMALELRALCGGKVKALCMGPPQAKEALLEALCIGADEAFLLNDRRFAGADVLATAHALKSAVCKMKPYDLILCGKQTTDGDTAQVGPELAELLGIEHSCYVQAVEVEDGITVHSNMGDSIMVQKMDFPCLLTVEKDANTPRLPGYLRGCEVSEKDILCLSLDDLEDTDETQVGLCGSPTRVERIFPPEHNRSKQMLTGSAAQLGGKLYELLSKGKYI